MKKFFGYLIFSVCYNRRNLVYVNCARCGSCFNLKSELGLLKQFEDNGWLMVMGRGSWTGYYGHALEIHNLPKPHPKEELFIYGQ